MVGLFSFLPSLGAPPLPSFQKPTKGFDPRGTFLSNRIHTLYLIDKYINSGLLIEQGSNVRRSVSVRKRRSNNENSECQETFRGRIVFTSTKSSNLMTTENLKSLCHLEKKIMKSAPPSYDNFYFGGSPSSCQSHSLGVIVTQFSNKTKCESIDDNDVRKAMDIFEMCSAFYNKGTLNKSCDCKNLKRNGVSDNCPTVPCVCSWKKIVYNTMMYFTDSEFLKTPDQKKLTYAAVVTPTKYNAFELYKYIYDNHLKSVFPEFNGVKVVGFHFANFRFDLFNAVVLQEVKYPISAMILVAICMWLFMESLILSLCAVLTIGFAFVLSYFFYILVYGFAFFPFFNLLTVIFIVGIGADDAFVYYDIFRKTKSDNPKDNLLTLTVKSLKHAAISMFVTSFTTSAAFFANMSSHITAIKTFGIFAGISILTTFLLMITWFPINVMLHERWIQRQNLKKSFSEERLFEDSPKIKETHYCEPETGEQESPKQSLCCMIFRAMDFPCRLVPMSKTLFSKLSENFFESWLPSMIFKKKLYLLWIIFFAGLTGGFSYLSLVSPGLHLPKITDFQMFSSSSTIEQYNLHIKQHFRYANDVSVNPKMEIELIWGVKPVDNGNYLDPDDKGTLDYDHSFNPKFTSDSQIWLSSFCKSLRKQVFYSGRSGSLCSFETIRNRCSQSRKPLCCKNATFPFPKDIIENCMTELGLPRHDIYHPRGNNNTKMMRISFSSNVHWSKDYNEMDTFWKQIFHWSNEQFSQAPPEFKNGWIACERLHLMYSIQECLLKDTVTSMMIAIGMAFVVMLLTTLNVLISIYAIVTIIGIIATTVGSLVLLGWELVVLESIVLSVAVGLSIDFTMHYGVAYRLSPNREDRKDRVRYSFMHVGPAVFMATFTTFITGLVMMPADVLVYIQLGQFIMIVMFFSWLFSNFAFMSLNAFIGPTGNFAQLNVIEFCERKKELQIIPDEKKPKEKSKPVDTAKTSLLPKTHGIENKSYTD
ncbi:protein dispatched homolog 1 isoform X2 [Exaiptasia diaphana]|nr:protein dispatched homolog 1 isoform X2 [Exaiptasia diaphana]